MRRPIRGSLCLSRGRARASRHTELLYTPIGSGNHKNTVVPAVSVKHSIDRNGVLR